MIRSHRYSGLRTIGDMKRAIADAEELGYTDEAEIKFQLFADPNTYSFNQIVVPVPEADAPNVDRPATDKEVKDWLA